MIRLGKFITSGETYEITNISSGVVTVEWNHGKHEKLIYPESKVERYFKDGSWVYSSEQAVVVAAVTTEPACVCAVVSAHDIDCAWLAWRKTSTK